MKPTMNKEIKQMWVDALRSGLYTQGKACLRKNNDFCCLGVLSDLAEKDGVGYWKDDKFHIIDDDDFTISLSSRVSVWAEMKNISQMGTFYVGGEYGMITLSKLNDDGYSFVEIADIIEKEIDGV